MTDFDSSTSLVNGHTQSASGSVSNPNVYVDQTAVGAGVFAARDLLPTNWILSFEGPTIAADHPVADLDEGGVLFQTAPDEYQLIKPPGVLVNHSCEPNAAVLNGRHLIALQAVEEGEELRYDYSTTMDENEWTLDCECGASSCRGTVEDFHQLPESRRQTYLDLGIVVPFIADAYA